MVFNLVLSDDYPSVVTPNKEEQEAMTACN